MRKPRCLQGIGVSCKREKRREVEKRICGGESVAAHGFRNLSVFKIIRGFELQMTEIRTNCDQIVNKFPGCILFLADIDPMCYTERQV